MGVWKGQNLPFRIDHLIRRRRMLVHWLPGSPGWGYLLFSIVYSCLMYCRWIDEKCMGLLLSSVFCSIGPCVCFCAANTLLWLLYCIVYAQVRECHSSRFVLPSQDCCCYLESFGFLTDLEIICSPSVKNALGVLVGVHRICILPLALWSL